MYTLTAEQVKALIIEIEFIKYHGCIDDLLLELLDDLQRITH